MLDGIYPIKMRNPLTAKRIYPFSWEFSLLRSCYTDVACASGLKPSSQLRDLHTCRERLDREGLSFLTKTLPLLGKYLDKVLATPRENQNAIPPLAGFEKRLRDNGEASRIPKLFGDLVSLVIDDDGIERSDASSQAFGALRQITGLFYKTRYPIERSNEEKVISSFLQTESELPGSEAEMLLGLTPDSLSVLKTARRIIARLFGEYDPLDLERVIPRHGPGSVATGESSWEKPVFKRYYHALHSVFPYDSIMSYNLSSVSDSWEAWQDLESVDSGTAKVVLVPKDSRGPRLISCEPLEYQWVQQGLNSYMVDIMEDSHSLSSGFVNFTRQDHNRRLALEGSVVSACENPHNPGSIMLPVPWRPVTLDMKDASDRVTCSLVSHLFPVTWERALLAVRSTRTKLPDGRIVTLKKFAPMGSAVCFPVEAVIFWALSCAVVHNRIYGINAPLSRETLAACRCYVYGDDIVCPLEYSAAIMVHLEAVHLKVNRDKCCLGDSFRESCGCDAYRGVDVTPVRIREPLDSSFVGMSLFSWCATHNLFSARGLYNTCDQIQEWIQASGSQVPFVDEEQSQACSFCHLVDARKCAKHENSCLKIRFRYNRDLQRREIYTWRGRNPVKWAYDLPGWAEMLRMATLRGNPSIEEHLVEVPGSDKDLIPSAWLPPLERRGKAYQYTLARRVTRKRVWQPF